MKKIAVLQVEFDPDIMISEERLKEIKDIMFTPHLDMYLSNVCNELFQYVIKQKEVLDKIKKYCKNKIEEQKNMKDFSKYYLENYDKAINTQHLSHSGVMLETIKSTTIKRYENILELLEEIE